MGASFLGERHRLPDEVGKIDVLKYGLDNMLWDHSGKVAPIACSKQRRKSIPTPNPRFSAAFIYRQC